MDTKFILVCILVVFSIDHASAQCMNNCSYPMGECDPIHALCVCAPGNLGPDCSVDFLLEYGLVWDAARGVCGALFAILGILSGIAAFFSYRSVATVANVRRTVMTLVCICCWSQFLYCVWDPWLLRGIGNNTANNFIFGLFTYLSVAAYEIILFHWIEIYNISVTTLKRENLLIRINSSYKGKALTVEDVVQRVNLLKRLRIPFIASVIIIFALNVVDSVTQDINYSFYRSWDIAYYTIFLFCWLALSAGFLVYGRKLVSLMPRDQLKKVRSLTHRITVSSVCMLCEMIIITFVYFLSDLNDVTTFFAVFMTIEVIFFIWCFTTMCIFANRKFPFIFEVNTRSKSSDSGFTASKSLDLKMSSP